jgi:DNA-binding Xre family transcriptional regulator
MADKVKREPIIYCNLKNFLAGLEQGEEIKPVETRRHVPTPKEIALAIGVNPQTVYNLVNNNVKGITFDTFSYIIFYLRQQGFPVGLSDLLKYAELEYPIPEEAEEEANPNA